MKLDFGLEVARLVLDAVVQLLSLLVPGSRVDRRLVLRAIYYVIVIDAGDCNLRIELQDIQHALLDLRGPR